MLIVLEICRLSFCCKRMCLGWGTGGGVHFNLWTKRFALEDCDFYEDIGYSPQLSGVWTDRRSLAIRGWLERDAKQGAAKLIISIGESRMSRGKPNYTTKTGYLYGMHRFTVNRPSYPTSSLLPYCNFVVSSYRNPKMESIAKCTWCAIVVSGYTDSLYTYNCKSNKTGARMEGLLWV